MNNREFLFKLAAESPAKLAEWFDEEHEHQTSVGCDACLYKKQSDELEAECDEMARLLSECTIKRISLRNDNEQLEYEIEDTSNKLTDMTNEACECNSQLEELREKLSQAIHYAREIEKLIDLEAS